MANLLLAGYFGAGNLGDDSILLGFVHGLGSTEHNITVMSGNPDETYRNYGLRGIDRRDMQAYRRAIEECDVVVFPGGSIFQDSSSVRSVAFYGQLVKLAKTAGKKVALLAQGVGPLTTFFGKRWAASAFNMADVVTVRDPSSVSALQSLGVRRPIRVTADMAFLLPQPPDSDSGGFGVAGMKAVGISVRPHGKKDDVPKLFGEFARLLFSAQIMPVFLEMDKTMDGPLILEISKAQGGKIPDLRKMQTPMQVQQRMARLEAVVAMRLHAGILAATVGVPPFMVSYDPKVVAFSKLLEIQSAPNVNDLTPQRLFDSFMKFMKDRDKNARIMDRRREELIKLARMNIEILEEILPTAAKI